MSDQDAFERILAALHDTMLNDALWPETSALIDEACGVEGSALGVGPQKDTRVFFIGICYRGQRRVDYEREYLDRYLPLDTGMARLRQLPDSRLVRTTDLYAEELKTSSPISEGMRLVSMRDGVHVHLAMPESASSLWWDVADPVTRGGWDASHLALLTGLLPHIRQFVRVRQTLAEAQALRTSVTALLDHARVGVLHLDGGGRILEANDRARALLRQGDGVMDRDGLLTARVPADQARLERLIAAALSPSGAAAVSGSTRMHRLSGLPPFVVHVKPVGARQREASAERVAALVLLSEPEPAARIDPALVAATLGLSPRESQIAAWVADGRTVREIAGLLAQTEGSVRWYLHHIYQKHGLSGQVALARLVLAVTALA